MNKFSKPPQSQEERDKPTAYINRCFQIGNKEDKLGTIPWRLALDSQNRVTARSLDDQVGAVHINESLMIGF